MLLHANMARLLCMSGLQSIIVGGFQVFLRCLPYLLVVGVVTVSS